MSHNRIFIKAMRSARTMIQRGFSILSALFLLVVLSALGAFMVNFSTVQSASSVQDLLGAQAYQAARAGIEWGLFRVLQNTPPVCGGPTTVALGGALTGYAVSVACVDSGALSEGSNVTLHIYTITSTATQGVSGRFNYVSRQLAVSVERSL